MTRLTMDLQTSAEVLGTEPEIFLDLIQREQIKGVLNFKDRPKISIFTLARLLDTTPGALLELLEDYALAELIEEVEDDEWFEGEEGMQVYQQMLAEVNQ